MACISTAVMIESYEAPPVMRSNRSQYGTFAGDVDSQRRRRHSSYHIDHSHPWTVDHDNIQVFVDRFLAELGRRLDLLEPYGHLNIDAGIERAYSTLLAVRESCSTISDGVIDAGRRRANVLVDTLEERYKEALTKKETLEQKVQEGVQLMESFLGEFEARAYAMRDAGIGSVAGHFIDESWKRVDSGVGKAKHVVDEGLEAARRATQTIEHAVERALHRAREHGLIKYEDLPEPWKVNPFIHKGYRFHEGKLDCVRSLLSVHNELFNIWSHAIGFVMILSIAFYFYPTSVNFSHSTKADVFIAAVFFFAAAKCLVCSTIWHTMNSISHQTLLERFACVDYTGISLLVAASIMTTEYTAFYCEPVSRWLYMLTTAALGIGGVILPWHPTFNGQDMAWARVLFYVTLATTGFIPIFQLALTHGLAVALSLYAPVTKSIVVYLSGAVLYASKIPECWAPGMFDYVGGSHNIWHCAVLGGILFHYAAMQELFTQAFERAGVSCSVY